MNEPKLIIEIKEQMIHKVYSTLPLTYVFVDHDAIDYAGDPVYGPHPAEPVKEPLYLLFTGNDPNSQEIQEGLKRIHY